MIVCNICNVQNHSRIREKHQVQSVCVCVNFGLFNAGGPFWNVMISVGFLVGTLHQETHAGEKDQETRENGGGCQARKGVRLHSLAAVAQPWHFESPWSFHGIVLVPPTRF